MILRAKEVLKEVDNQATIIAATKYFDVTQMRELYKQGIHHFGENRVESFLSKAGPLQDVPIKWHFIGTLQTKKVKKIIDQIDFLHSLDNIKLAIEINKRRSSPLKCFIQVNISNEESKHGLNPDEVIPFIEELLSFDKINIIGFMGMASYTKNKEEIRSQFLKLNRLLEAVNTKLNLHLKDLSMGMSNDYPIALEQKSTYLRLGSVLFKKEVE